MATKKKLAVQAEMAAVIEVLHAISDSFQVILGEIPASLRSTRNQKLAKRFGVTSFTTWERQRPWTKKLSPLFYLSMQGLVRLPMEMSRALQKTLSSLRVSCQNNHKNTKRPLVIQL